MTICAQIRMLETLKKNGPRKLQWSLPNEVKQQLKEWEDAGVVEEGRWVNGNHVTAGYRITDNGINRLKELKKERNALQKAFEEWGAA